MWIAKELAKDTVCCVCVAACVAVSVAVCVAVCTARSKGHRKGPSKEYPCTTDYFQVTEYRVEVQCAAGCFRVLHGVGGYCRVVQ